MGKPVTGAVRLLKGAFCPFRTQNLAIRPLRSQSIAYLPDQIHLATPQAKINMDIFATAVGSTIEGVQMM